GHRFQSARSVSRRHALLPARRELPRTVEGPLHWLRAARTNALAGQGPVEEADEVSQHTDAGVPCGAARTEGETSETAQISADRQKRDGRCIGRNFAGFSCR